MVIELPEDYINPGEDISMLEGDNAFEVMGAVFHFLRRAGNPQSVIDAYRVDATSAGYEHLWEVSCAYAGMGEDD